MKKINYIAMSGLFQNPRLYSTVRVCLLDDDLNVEEALYEEAAQYCEDVANELKNFRTKEYPDNNLMRYFTLSDKQIEAEIKRKIISAFPNVKAIGKKLYAVLKLTMTADLSVNELELFAEQIKSQYADGWGGDFEIKNLLMSNSDMICLRLYHEDMSFYTGAAFEKLIHGQKELFVPELQKGISNEFF